MYWLDTRDGKLVIGEAAYETSVENSFPDDIRLLAEVIFTKKLDFPTSHFDKLDTSKWDRDECIVYGRWLINFLSSDDRYNGLSRRYVERMSKLGLGIGRMALMSRFGPNFTDYLSALGEQGHRQEISDCASWSRRQHAEYAQSLTTQLGHPPTHSDFDAADGPGANTLTKYMGTPGEINELNGYPNVYCWEREDFITWGMRVMAVNNGSQLTNRLISALSLRSRGPATRTIMSEFGSLSEFQEIVEERYQTDPTNRKVRQAAARARLTELAEQKLFNQWQLQYIQSSEVDIIEVAAKYDVLVDLKPDVDELELGYIALEPTDTYVQKISGLLPNIKLEDIQLAAIATKHTNDIWPLSHRWDKHLRVTKPQLKYKRKINRDKYGPRSKKNIR